MIYPALGTAKVIGMVLFPGTTSPLVVNVTPAKASLPISVAAGAAAAEVTAAALEDALAILEDTILSASVANTPGLALGSAPSALATATGRLVRPGVMSAAIVTNLRTVATPSILPSVAVGAAMTEVEIAFWSPAP